MNNTAFTKRMYETMKNATVTLFVTALLAAGSALAGSPQLSPDLRGPRIARDLLARQGNEKVDVIIRFRKSARGPRLSQAGVPDQLAIQGGKRKARLDFIRSGAYSISASALTTLANRPDIEFIAPDREVRGTLDHATPSVGGGLAHQYGWDGSGIGVAVIDSGIMLVDDLKKASGSGSRIVYQQNFVPGDDTDDLDDIYGHGTHIAGIIAGNGITASPEKNDYSVSFRGIAPDADLINLRVLDANGVGSDSSVIAAIQRAIELKNQYNIRVINLSVGRPVFESYQDDPLCQAVEAAWEAGIVVVVASGNMGRDNSFANEGYGTITSPESPSARIAISKATVPLDVQMQCFTPR